MEKFEKATVVLYAIMIGLGFYSLVNWFSYGITPARVMSIVGLAVVATFVELRYSYNRGVRFILEVGRDILGGLGSLSILFLLPISISEELSVVVMLCQCPQSGLYHFYITKKGCNLWKKQCVNALSRAYTFSLLNH